MSFNVASGGMALPLRETGSSELKLRIVSALVLAPVVLGAIILGSPFFEIVMIVAGLAMAWEWDRLCGDRKFGPGGAVVSAALVVIGLAAVLDRYDIALIAIAAATVIAYVAARLGATVRPGWAAAGAIVIGVPCLAAIWLRSDPEFGLHIVIWLIGAVWATDVGGYVFGRTIGGPKLAPRISPGKTWSGLGGAVAMAAAWGVAWGYWSAAPDPWMIGLLGGVVGVVAQCGDLSVSFVKRRFGVKDASNLIPGHGGVLDRFDGLLSTAPTLALFIYMTHGSRNLWG
jgi:phosphatidate cytidylyltransferase